jgi:DNA-binding NarL/FixJ family response regulator
MGFVMIKPTIRILLADDHQIVLDSLSNLLSSLEGIEVIGKVINGKFALELLEHTEVDMLIADLNMPECGGVELCTQIRQRFPAVKILMLTMADDIQSIRAAIRAGAMGYVLKRTGLDELKKAIFSLQNNQKYFSDEVIAELVSGSGENAESFQSKPNIPLTEREIEVLKLIAKEYSTPQIAEKLFISVATVETHRQRMSQKIGVKGAVGLVLYAMKQGLLD